MDSSRGGETVCSRGGETVCSRGGETVCSRGGETVLEDVIDNSLGGNKVVEEVERQERS